MPEYKFGGCPFRTSTSNSPNLSKKGTQEVWNKDLNKDEKVARDPPILSISCTLPYEGACNIGVHGILRKLLFNKVHHSVYGSFMIRAIVDYKWRYVLHSCFVSACHCWTRLYAKRLMIQELIYFAFAFLGFVIYCCMLICGESSDANSEHDGEEDWSFQIVAFIVCWVPALPRLYREVNQCLEYTTNHRFQGFIYWLTSAWNWIEVLSFVIVVVIIPLGHLSILLDEGYRSSTLSAFVAIELLLLCSRMLFYARPFDNTGPLVITISAIVSESVNLLWLVLSVMLGFTLAFSVLYRHVKPAEDSTANDTSFSHVDAHHTEVSDDYSTSMYAAFGTFKRSFFTVFTYTFGEFDLEILYHAPEPNTALFLFALYVVIISVFLLNMLIALMSDKCNSIHDERRTRFIESRARVIDYVESMLSHNRKMRLRWIHKNLSFFKLIVLERRMRSTFML